MSNNINLTGKMVLVVEDDPLAGVLVENILLDVGCLVRGPYMKFDEAARNIPFILMTGYVDGARPPGHLD
jgi:hypothetical protein